MKQQRIAVYPGSFDPLHNGHLDVIRRCRPLFDEVVVAVLHNTAKTDPFLKVERRVELIRAAVADLEGVRVETFSGLLVHFMEQIGAQTVVRGLRGVADFEFEAQMAGMNRRLDPRRETIFLAPKEDLSFLSSRLVREVWRLGGDCRGLLPDVVLEGLPPLPRS
jgi:pantetheine-phosphate adenylyltransferase